MHQANTDVDERGTDAAATAVLGDTAGCNGPTPAKWITLRFDRPFLFLLRDVPTGAVLFMGRVWTQAPGAERPPRHGPPSPGRRFVTIATRQRLPGVAA